MINGEINDGPLAETLPLQQGKGFQDYSRNVSWQLQVANKSGRSSNVSLFQKHFTFYAEPYITTTMTKTH